MTIDDFRQKIGAQLARVEENPKFYISITAWNDTNEIGFSFGFYPKTKQGKLFLKQCYQDDKEKAGVLINALAISIDGFLKVHIIHDNETVTKID